MESNIQNEQEILNRWRLILGTYAASQLPFSSDGLRYMDMENVLDYLYSREYGEEQNIRPTRSAGSGGSALTVPEWIQQMKRLFPKESVEIMERHALEKYELTELLTDPEVLQKLEPNHELLKTILSLKHLMKGQVLQLAREIVKKVADELMEQLKQDVRQTLLGQLDRTSSTPVRSMHNLDISKTIRRNLPNYDLEKQQLLLKQVYFHGRQQRFHAWRLIICVDESGSMLDSVIYSAVMTGIFARLPMLDTKLIIFDTNVVDLSGYVQDPVEILMSVQLGGGTNIASALSYCETLIENPHRTLVVLVSDLYESGGYGNLFRVCRNIIESGAKLLALTALDLDANPSFDRRAAATLAELGAFVGAMTPEKLAEHVGQMLS